jgi:cytosine/adenosine deaminase-related metal-dependent hydrolase
LDPVRSLVAFGKGQDVDTVYVDGRAVVEGGSVLNVDEEELQAAAPGILRDLAQAASARDPQGRTLESILGLEEILG